MSLFDTCACRPKNLPAVYFEQLSPLDASQTIKQGDLFLEIEGRYLDVDAVFVSTTYCGLHILE